MSRPHGPGRYCRTHLPAMMAGLAIFTKLPAHVTATQQQPLPSPGFSTSNAASARAIADNAGLSLTAGGNATAFALGVTGPRQSTPARTSAARGYSDIVALIALYHRHALHCSLQPAQALQAHLFNEFERARCEALGSQRLIGSATNLAAFWHEHGPGQLTSSRSDSERQVITVISAVRDYLGLASTDILSGEFAQSFAEQQHDPLKNLSLAINDQHRYGLLALQIIASADLDAVDVNQATTGLKPQESNEESSPDDHSQNTDDAQQPETDDTLSVNLREEEHSDAETITCADAAASDSSEATANRDAPVNTESEGVAAQPDAEPAGYRIFSRSEDEVVQATDLCSQQQLLALRDLLDQQIHRHARVIGKLSGKLQRVLMAEQTRHWEFNLPEGVLDATRLTRVVTQPMAPLSFKQETDSQFKDTSITLLVDNSRSMLGKPIAIAAACSDLLSQTLERCGVSVEILGFTTTELHRGPLHERWTDEGATPEPGRLNGLRHIVYKSSDQGYRRSRPNFGAMLMKDLLKQNIDGESLQWAYQRLLRRPENRKVLIVISDGAPIDTSTMASNRENYLVDHLKTVIRQIETSGQVELLAIGIGHDVTRYYQRSMKIMDVKELSASLLAHMSELFSHSTRHGYSKAR